MCDTLFVLKGLYALGARRIGVFSAPPIGCLPSQRTLGGGVERDCADKPNQAAMLFNSKLSAELDDLKNNLPNSMLIYVDIYNPLLDMIINPTNYGKTSTLSFRKRLDLYSEFQCICNESISNRKIYEDTRFLRKQSQTRPLTTSQRLTNLCWICIRVWSFEQRVLREWEAGGVHSVQSIRPRDVYGWLSLSILGQLPSDWGRLQNHRRRTHNKISPPLGLNFTYNAMTIILVIHIYILDFKIQVFALGEKI